MTRAILFAMSLALSAGAMAGPGAAQSMSLFGARNDDGVTIIYINKYYGDDDEAQQIPLTYRQPSPQTLANAQDEIASDRKLRSILQSKSIQLRNVVGVQTALNGGKVVYVR